MVQRSRGYTPRPGNLTRRRTTGPPVSRPRAGGTLREATRGGHSVSEEGGVQRSLEVVYNVDRILDCHTHLTGREGESAESILRCMDFCGVEKVFLFAPMLEVGAHEITSDSLHDIRTHNDYCADLCSRAPERLLGFCSLNPIPDLADGDLDAAVDLMIDEARRCYHELGRR